MKKLFATGLLAILPSIASAEGFCDRYDCQGTADKIIYEDARSWFMNRYDRGSATVRDVWESTSGLDVTLTVDYTYNGGSRGWVEIETYDGRVKCLRFHDFANTCRPPK